MPLTVQFFCFLFSRYLERKLGLRLWVENNPFFHRVGLLTLCKERGLNNFDWELVYFIVLFFFFFVKKKKLFQ
jgi:hypothetical protein